MALTDAKQLDDRRWPVQGTVQQLILAAGLVISRRGGDFSMSEIAAEASVSRPTLYRYFPTKSDVLHAVAADSRVRFAAGLEAATDGVPPAERLERALDYVAEFQRTLPRAIINVAPGFALRQLADALPHMRASIIGLLADCFDDPAASGPSPQACHDIADRIVRTAMSYFLFPGEDPADLAKALRTAAGFPPLRQAPDSEAETSPPTTRGAGP
jgi:AcrR family transcriptional regulator